MSVEIIAHRGFSSIAPENTLNALLAAIYNQANSIEFDVQITADSVPVVFHDKSLNRITGTAGTIREKTISELKELDAGAWFGESYRGERIPTLEEALAALKLIKGWLYFDIKPHAIWSDIEIKTLLGLIREANLGDRTILTSFDEDLLWQCRQSEPQIKLGYFVVNESQLPEQISKAQAAGNAILSSQYQVILDQPSIIKETRDKGVDIVVWTVDNINDFERLVDVGIDRIITNSLIGDNLIKNITN
ncbi:MAG: glycerophosphodiester phosphodiesterase family protein [Arthrospira platensis PCC 7345]|uniref:glycerophosphodiester phosphodiesterase n=1 Tax=Limnospira platensis TaxID=118562 RepID=UPI0028E0BF6B|nr:glycerophosphodiester phosphodiesterase family protein [Arthrospira platensis PCC 7345]